MTEQEFLKEIFMYCIIEGDQKLWNIVYPYLIQKGFKIDKNIIKDFSIREQVAIFSASTFVKEDKNE